MEQSLFKKIAKVRSEIGVLVKNEINPFFKSKYFDINGLVEAVVPLLQKENLLLLQPITDGIVKSVIVDIDGGTQVESGLLLPKLDDPQKIGSAITYYRRYTLQSLLALQAEDDDGNTASGHNNKSAQKQQIEMKQAAPQQKWLNILDNDKNYTKEWYNVLNGIEKGTITSVADVRKYYAVNKEVAAQIENLLNSK